MIARYVRLIGSMVVRSAGTLDELFQAELRSWKRNQFKSTPVDYVDTWNEPGRLVRGGSYDSYWLWEAE